MTHDPIRARLKAEIDAIPIIDTHEHIGVEHGICEDSRETTRQDRDLFDILFSAYLWGVLANAGVRTGPIQRIVADREASEDGKWKAIKPLLPLIENVGTYRAYFQGFQDLYGFDDFRLTDANWRGLSDRIKEVHRRTNKRVWMREVFHRCGVEKALRIVTMKYFLEYLPSLTPQEKRIEHRLFVPVMQLDCFLYGWRKDPKNSYVQQTEDFKRATRFHPDSFAGYLHLIELAFGFIARRGIRAIKFHSSYLRSLHFADVDLSVAEKLFRRPEEALSAEERKSFEDAIMRFILAQAGKHGMVAEFHTGLGNPQVELTNPTLMEEMFAAHRDVRFALFHAGYPFVGQWLVKGLRSPNVFLDLNWTPLLSPEVFRNALSEGLELLQANKLMVGGDVAVVEHLYGVAHRIREALADVLAEKVARGYFDEELALGMARRVLRENAREVYGLP